MRDEGVVDVEVTECDKSLRSVRRFFSRRVKARVLDDEHVAITASAFVARCSIAADVGSKRTVRVSRAGDAQREPWGVFGPAHPSGVQDARR